MFGKIKHKLLIPKQVIISVYPRSVQNEVTEFKSNSTGYKPFDQIPGPKSLPVIGTLHKYLPYIGIYSLDRMDLNGRKKYEMYGPIVRETIVPGATVIWVFKPEDIRAVYNADGKYPYRRSHLALGHLRKSRPEVYESSGLITTNGPDWAKLRSPIQSKLSRPQNLKRYIPLINSVLDDFAQQIKNKNGKIEDFLSDLSRVFLELICLVIFDVRLNCFSEKEMLHDSISTRLIQAAYDTNSCILKTDNGLQLWRFFDTPKYKKIKESQLFMEKVALKFVTKAQQEISENNTEDNLSILKQLLSSPDLSFKDIIAFSSDMLLAGVDTTSYTSSFLFYHLSTNPKVQANLFKEAIELLPNKDSPITSDVLDKAKYTKAVLKESLRMNPVSIGVGRILQQDTVLSGYLVPKGINVVTQNQVLCRLEEYFSEPDKFIPERWIKGHELYKQHDPYLVLPFGHGPRSCIARRIAEQNMHILILKMARNFIFDWIGDGELEVKTILINEPDRNIALKVSQRVE